MSTTCTFNKGKTILKIFNYYTEPSVEELRQLVEKKVIVPEKYTYASVDYNANEGFPVGETEELFRNPDFFPLKFYADNNNVELWVSGVSAGYHGTGPRGTLDALEILGFKLTEDQEYELTSRKDIHFIYYK